MSPSSPLKESPSSASRDSRLPAKRLEELGLSLTATLLLFFFFSSLSPASRSEQYAAVVATNTSTSTRSVRILSPIAIDPKENSILSSTQAFTWDLMKIVSEHEVSLGTTRGGSQIFRGKNASSTISIKNIPQNGRTIYLRISYRDGNVLNYQDISYKTKSLPTSVNRVTPPPGSALSSGQTITWNEVRNATEYSVSLGTTKGGKDIFSKSVGSATSTNIGPIPSISANALYLRIFYKLGKSWRYKDATYKTTAGLAVPQAVSQGSIAPSVSSEDSPLSASTGPVSNNADAFAPNSIAIVTRLNGRVLSSSEATGCTSHFYDPQGKNNTGSCVRTFTNPSPSGTYRVEWNKGSYPAGAVHVPPKVTGPQSFPPRPDLGTNVVFYVDFEKASGVPPLTSVAPDKLVAFYKFEGDFKDSSGNANDGVLHGDTMIASLSNANFIAEFDGVDDYVEVPHKEILNLDAMTVSFWTKPSYKGYAGKQYAVVDKSDNTSAADYRLALTGEEKGFNVASISIPLPQTTNPSLTITSIGDTVASIASDIEIHGTGFDSANNTVRFSQAGKTPIDVTEVNSKDAGGTMLEGVNLASYVTAGTYVVTVINSKGTSNGVEIVVISASGSMNSPLSAPTNLIARYGGLTSGGKHIVHLTWDDNSGNEDGFVITVKNQHATCTDCATSVPANTESYKVYLDDLGHSTNEIRVHAFREGESSLPYLARVRVDGGDAEPLAPASPSQWIPLDNKWHHVIQTRDARGAVRYYVDGTLVSTVTSSLPYRHTTTPLLIGVSRNTDFFNGSLDSVMLYNKALSSTEVLTLYKEQRNDFRAINGYVTNLKAFEKLAEPALTNALNELEQLSLTYDSAWNGHMPNTLRKGVDAESYLKLRWEAQKRFYVAELKLMEKYSVLAGGKTANQVLARYEPIWEAERVRQVWFQTASSVQHSKPKLTLAQRLAATIVKAFPILAIGGEGGDEELRYWYCNDISDKYHCSCLTNTIHFSSPAYPFSIPDMPLLSAQKLQITFADRIAKDMNTNICSTETTNLVIYTGVTTNNIEIVHRGPLLLLDAPGLRKIEEQTVVKFVPEVASLIVERGYNVNRTTATTREFNITSTRIPPPPSFNRFSNVKLAQQDLLGPREVFYATSPDDIWTVKDIIIESVFSLGDISGNLTGGGTGRVGAFVDYIERFNQEPLPEWADAIASSMDGVLQPLNLGTDRSRLTGELLIDNTRAAKLEYVLVGDEVQSRIFFDISYHGEYRLNAVLNVDF